MGPTLLQNRNNVTDSQKRTGSLGAEHPTDPATSSEFAGLLTRVDANTQSLCVAVDGDEVTPITLKLEVMPNVSLRALVDCGVPNNFVQRQPLSNSEFNYVEREIIPTRIKVRLATGVFVKVMKRVVGIAYTLKEVQYNDEFIILDLDDIFDIILGFAVAQKVRATSQLTSTNSRYACCLFIRWPSDERHGASTNMWMYCE